MLEQYATVGGPTHSVRVYLFKYGVPYAQTLILVVLIVAIFFGFLVIARYPTMRF